MSYNDWLKMIRHSGADPRQADPNWLKSQFQAGALPVLIANDIIAGRFPRRKSAVPRQTRRPVSAVGKLGIGCATIFLLLGLWFMLTTGLRMIAQPHLAANWTYNGSKYSIVKITNESGQKLTGLQIWFDTPSDDRVFGDLVTKTLAPGQSTKASFDYEDIPAYTTLDGRCSSGGVFIFTTN
ncbi:MAG: hypothetical protein JST51_20575 [Armatimonadetes bacterium]|nr:hypothetical protein [Armatimonadota bacterium]